MNRNQLIQATLAVLILSVLGAAQLQPTPTDPQRIKTLENDYAALRSQYEGLLKQNLALKQQVRQLQVQLASQNQSPSGSTPNPIPDSWTPRQFNGTTFYLVPLGATQNSVPTTRPTR